MPGFAPAGESPLSAMPQGIWQNTTQRHQLQDEDEDEDEDEFEFIQSQNEKQQAKLHMQK